MFIATHYKRDAARELKLQKWMSYTKTYISQDIDSMNINSLCKSDDMISSYVENIAKTWFLLDKTFQTWKSNQTAIDESLTEENKNLEWMYIFNWITFLILLACSLFFAYFCFAFL